MNDDGEARRDKVIGELAAAIGAARSDFRTQADVYERALKAVDNLEKKSADMNINMQRLQSAFDGLSRKIGRPGGADLGGQQSERQAAVGLLEMKHALKVPKHDIEHAFTASEDEIAEAQTAIQGIKNLLRVTSIDQIPLHQRKALTSFSIGSSGFILPPEMSGRILSCLEDVTDVSGLVGAMSISSASVKFLVDDARITEAAWACQTDCFANNPSVDITKNLGELEIRPETLRFVLCTSRDILEDASVDMEAWMLGKVNFAFRNTISNAIMVGDGVGKPLGILHPSSGIPVCDTAAGMPAG
jgi:HK97 family phage major capsid protein